MENESTVVNCIYALHMNDCLFFCGGNQIGEAYYNEAVLPFYKALKVYPAPMELLGIYQKTIPEAVLQVIVNVLTIEVCTITILFFLRVVALLLLSFSPRS